MATIDLAKDVQRRWEPPVFRSGVFTLYNRVDFSRNNGGSGDTIKVLPVKEGWLVLQVGHVVVTAEGGTSTGTIGDGDDPDGFIASVNNNATAGTAVVSKSSIKQDFIDGGAAGDHTVTGITTADTLVSVLHDTSGGVLADLTGEFTIDSDDTINNDGGTATTSDSLLVTWQRQGTKYYSAEDTIDMVLSAHAVDTAVIDFFMLAVEVAQ